MLKSLILSVSATVFVLLASVPLAAPVLAIDAKAEACKGANFGDAAAACEETGFTNTFRSIVDVLIFIIGAIAVLMIIIGSIRFVVSSGNDQAVAGARNTVLYAVVGLIIAILAYSIVHFVIDRVA